MPDLRAPPAAVAAARRHPSTPVLLVGFAFLLALVYHAAIRDLVWALGRYTPSVDKVQDLATGIAVALVVGWSVRFWPVPDRDRTFLRRAWWAHAAFALGPVLLLEYWEDSWDGFRHFRETQPLDSPVSLGRRNLVVEALAWFPIHYLDGSFQATKLLFILPGVIGCYVMYRAAVPLVGPGDRRPLYVFMFFPTLFFWGSFLTKEPFTYLAIGMYLYGGVHAWTRRSPKLLLVSLAGIVLGAIFRPWLFFILLAPLVVFPLAAIRTRRQAGLAVAGVLLVAVGTWVSLDATLERFEIHDASSFVSRLDSITGQPESQGATSRPAPSFESVGDVLWFLPRGMVAVLFGPMPWEMDHPVVWAGGIESLVLIGVLFLPIAACLTASRRARLRSPVFLWIVLLLLVWAAAYSFALYQTIGISVRTRTMVVPAMLLVPMVLLGRPQQDPRPMVQVTDAPTPEHVLRAELEAARRRGHLVEIATPARSGPWAVVRLARAWTRSRPALVHAHGRRAGRVAMAAAWLAAVPGRVHTLDGAPRSLRSPQGLRRRAAHLLACGAAQVVLVESAEAGDAWMRAGVVAPHKVRLPSHGVAPVLPTELAQLAGTRSLLRRKADLPDDAFVVGCIVEPGDARELAVLAAAVDRVRDLHPHVRLLLVEGPDAKAAALAPFATRVAAGEGIEPWYAAMDVVAVVSPDAPLARALAPALRSLAVVVVDGPGRREVVLDGASGAVVAAGDLPALARALEAYARDEKAALEHGAFGAEHVRRRFPVSSFVDELDEVYAEVLRDAGLGEPRAPGVARAAAVVAPSNPRPENPDAKN